MFTVLADAMYVATLTRHGSPTSNGHKNGRHEKAAERARRQVESYRNMW